MTPDDEHTGRGEAIRQARRDGLDHARQRRLGYHRRTSTNPGQFSTLVPGGPHLASSAERAPPAVGIRQAHE